MTEKTEAIIGKMQGDITALLGIIQEIKHKAKTAEKLQ